LKILKLTGKIKMKKTKKETKKKSKEKITADMTFGEVMSRYPKTQGVFMKHGMACFGCAFAMQETVEQGAMAHGIDAKKLLEELNKAAK
jgi:hybrid cluster-associated redox disulfide protein